MNVINQMISVLTPKHIVTIRLVHLCVLVLMGILEMEVFAKVTFHLFTKGLFTWGEVIPVSEKIFRLAK